MKQNGLNIHCTEDYAVLYWDKPATAPRGAEYTVSLNGEAIGRTDKTHFTIEGLSYGSTFRVDVVSGSYCVGSATLQFGQEKHRIDITAAPYFCRGDGQLLNTDNLQRAINDCGPDDILIKTEGCGICAGDLKCMHGAERFWGTKPHPHGSVRRSSPATSSGAASCRSART